MMREHESFVRRLEDGLSRMSGWLAARRSSDAPAGAPNPHARLEALRRELAQARHAVASAARADLARVRASFEDMYRDYAIAPPPVALSRAELEALRRHLHTTVRLLHDRATADNPEWGPANEEYDRSWAEVERAFESRGDAASP
jgi:capsule polysaccharide export protein KpsE/RkpR